MRILALIDGYLPGFRYGGPVRSLANMVELLREDHQFWIYTRNHDRGERVPYPGVSSDSWNQVGRAQVFYGTPSHESLARLRRLVREVQPDVLYANSFFARNTIRALILSRLGLIHAPLVVAPRGEAAPSALGLKRHRKQLYMRLGGLLRLFEAVVWQAATDREAAEIRSSLGGGRGLVVMRNVLVAPDLLGAQLEAADAAPRHKQPGEVRLVFISRITRMKNLASALRWVGRLRGRVTFDIYGPIDEPTYWTECQSIAAGCGAGVDIQYIGPLAPADVGPTFARYHFSVLPTLGESFGHTIFESLQVGTPVVLSDRTPWSPADAGAGWTLSLDDEAGWVAALQACVDMPGDVYAAYVRAAAGLAGRAAGQSSSVRQNVALFETALGRRGQVPPSTEDLGS